MASPERKTSFFFHLDSIPNYTTSSTLFILHSEFLQPLFLHALQANKKILFASHKLRRGFILLDPRRILKEKWDEHSTLHDFESIGRRISLAEMKEEGLKIDVCIGEGIIWTSNGAMLGGLSKKWFNLCWGVLFSVGVVEAKTAVITVVESDCIPEFDSQGDEGDPETWDVGSDFIISLPRVTRVERAKKPECGILWDSLQEGMMESIPPLQELKGIQMMEKIMKRSGPTIEVTDPAQKVKTSQKIPETEELMGIQMVERIMRGYKA